MSSPKGASSTMSPQSARKYLKDNKVKYILAQFVDIHGAAKAKAVPVEHLDMMLNEGAGFAGFALWGFGMGPHGPDYMAVGDPSTDQGGLHRAGQRKVRVNDRAEPFGKSQIQPFAFGRHIQRARQEGIEAD